MKTNINLKLKEVISTVSTLDRFRISAKNPVNVVKQSNSYQKDNHGTQIVYF